MNIMINNYDYESTVDMSLYSFGIQQTSHT